MNGDELKLKVLVPWFNHPSFQGVVFNHNGKLIAIAELSEIIVFNCETGSRVGAIPNHGDTWDFAFTPDNGLLVCSPFGIEVWDNRLQSRTILLRSPKLGYRFTCAKNGVFFAFRQDKEVSIHSSQDGKELFALKGGYAEARFTDTGNSILLGGETMFGYKSSIYSIQTKSRIAVLKRKVYRPSNLIQHLKTGDVYCFWSVGSELRVENLTSKTMVSAIPFPSREIKFMDVSPLGGLMVVSEGRNCKLLAVTGDQIVDLASFSVGDNIEQLVLSPAHSHLGFTFKMFAGIGDIVQLARR